MTYEMYRYLFYGTGIACLLMLTVSVVLFFVLHIPSVINDLTGRTARRAIEDIRNQNHASGAKNHKPSAVNRQRGKVTEKISASGKLQKRASMNDAAPSVTERIDRQPEAGEGSSETTILEQNQNLTTVLQQESGETSVLSQPAEMAQPIPVSPEPVSQMPGDPDQQFSIDYEITYIHTDEVIA